MTHTEKKEFRFNFYLRGKLKPPSDQILNMKLCKKKKKTGTDNLRSRKSTKLYRRAFYAFVVNFPHVRLYQEKKLSS